MRIHVKSISVLLICTFFIGAFSGCSMEKAFLVIKSLLKGSGAPPKAEREAINQREKEFFAAGKNQSITVYGVYRFKEGKDHISEEATGCLVEKLSELGFNKVERFSEPISFVFTPQPNEMAIFWERAKAFRKEIQQQSIETGAVLMLDIFASWNKDYIHAVHAVGCNTKGEILYIGFWNCHQPLYKELQPNTIEDAVKMLVVDFKRNMNLD